MDIQIFFSYSHKDRKLRDQLENHLFHLKYRGIISTWDERQIGAGEDQQHEINTHLSTAHIILLLISADFMASEYCNSVEMKRALERHKRGEADVIPILLRPVVYRGMPFAKLKLLPTNGLAVTKWQNCDEAFVDIAQGIERVAIKRLASMIALDLGGPLPGPQAQLLEERLRRALLEEAIDLDAGPMQPHIEDPQRAKDNARRRELERARRQAREREAQARLDLEHARREARLAALEREAEQARQKREQAWREWEALGPEEKQTRRRELERARREAREHEKRQEREACEREAAARRQILELARREAQQREAAAARPKVYYENALAAYEQALRLNNADATAYRGKGNALVGLERYDEALIAFEQATTLAPLPITYVSMGKVLATLGHCNEAVAAYERALALDTTYASAYAGMSEALFQLGWTEEAERASKQAKQLGDDDA